MSDAETPNQDTIQQQLKLLATHRERLAILLDQHAHFAAHVPPHILMEIRETQEALRPIKAWLRDAGMFVENEPNDDVQVAIAEKTNQYKIKPTLDRFESQLDSSKALILAKIDRSSIPQRLRKLLKSDSQFIDIPIADYITTDNSQKAEDFWFYKLKMRQTEAYFIIRVHKLTKTSDAAKYLILQIFPHMVLKDYIWSIEYNNKPIPSPHSFLTSGIPSGKTIFLVGNHRRPRIAFKRG